MQVWLLRHAAASWSMGEQDLERRLSPRGERDAERLRDGMARRGLVPDHVVTSPATRCVETVRRILPDRESVVDQRVYEASLHDLLAVLADAPEDAGRVLMVGHNPSLEMLVRALDPRLPPPTGGGLMDPCTLVCLEVDALRLGGGRVLDVCRPRDP